MKKLSVALAIAALSTGAMAQYTAGSIEFNGDNGHYYQLYKGTVTWNDAYAYSTSLSYLGLQGHLATVTSRQETNYLVTTFGGVNLASGSTAIGGRQAAGSLTRDSGWSWVTDEHWDYTDWNGDTNEPNDGWSPTEVGNENALYFAWNNNNGSWNDGPFTGLASGFLIEYSAPLNPGNNAVPEPSEWAVMGLLGTGLLGLVVRGRKKKLAN